MREIFTHLRTRTGQDFSNYKRATMLRRIERRLGINELTDLHEYAQFLRTDKHEANALMKDMLISVTNFFRDHEHLEMVAKKVVPAILKSKTEDDSVRVWVAGCATGEEAYSIAMVLSEAMSNMHSPHLQIFASDLDAEAVAKAREGHYSEAEVADISPERLRRFFLKDHEGYRVRREIREQILFACHNLIKDPPFSHLDLISCRNVLIYLNRTAQTHALEVMHFALNPGGYLFLGSSESIENADVFFTGFDRDHHIFQSRPVPTRHVFAPPDLAFKPLSFASPEKPRTAQETRAIERLSYVDLHQRLLEQISPPSVVVNEDYEIVHLSDSAGRYMQISGGEPTNNLLKLIRPELRLELRSALYQAVQQRIPMNTSEMSVLIEDGTTRPVRLSVRPVFREGDGTRGFVLVLFDQGEKSTFLPVKESSQSQEPITTHLEEELIQSKSQLRATVEQYEIQQEELRASNEELQAMNEELRSAAEELETSKEELQSVNEELVTVNQELKIKIEELGHSSNDFINLMNSTDIGTIFLDRTLTLMMFTPRAQDVFNLITSDISRPLLHITHKLKYDNLQCDIEVVIRTLHKLERDVETTDGRWFLMGILPYRTSEDRIDGVVMTFLEISSLKAAQQELEHARSELEQRVEARTSDLRETNLALSAEVQEHLKTEVIRVKLLTQLVNAQEAERRRLARDLHDQLGQQLTALRLKLETLKVESDHSEKLSSDVDALLAITEQLDSDIDFLAWELRPFALDDLGLPEAMGVYINRWAEHFNIAAQFHSGGFDSQRLASDVENHLYRIVQEALNNAAKHSSASQVDVLLERRDQHAVLIIEDNGVGLSDQSQNSGSMGLSGMRERASILGGSFEIESTPKVGTTVFVRIPIDGQAQK
jgi:two-component system CheB/CheR fusion protein